MKIIAFEEDEREREGVDPLKDEHEVDQLLEDHLLRPLCNVVVTPYSTFCTIRAVDRIYAGIPGWLRQSTSVVSQSRGYARRVTNFTSYVAEHISQT